MDQLDEANHFLAKKGPDKNAAVEESSLLLVYRFERLAVMAKRLSLADGALVIDGPDSANQGVIEGHFANDHAFFFGLFGLVAGLKTNLLGPPVLESGNGYGRQIVHLHGIREPGRSRRQPLQKREKIDALSAFPQAFQKWL